MARPRTLSDERLLDAAATAIGRRGPAFTLADVGREAGVAAGTLVQRFGSKHGMLLALTAAGTARTVGAMRDAAAAARPGAAAVRAALRVAVRDLGDPEAAANHLAQLGSDLADPVLRAAVRGDQRAVRAELRRLVAAAPDLPRAPRPGPAADALLAIWNGALLGWSLDPRGALERRVDREVGALLTGWAR